MPVIATDRGQSTPITGECLRGPGGVDTIRLRGPVHAKAVMELPNRSEHQRLDERTGELVVTQEARLVLPSGVLVRLDQQRRRAQPDACFEVSIPRLREGHNCNPATPVAVMSEVQSIYDEIGRAVEWECDVTDLNVMRLDLPYDFQSERPDVYADFLHRLARVPAPRVQGMRAYQDRDRTGLQTVNRQTADWMVRAYGKAESLLSTGRYGADAAAVQALARTVEGVLRVEVQLRSRACQAQGLRTLGRVVSADLAGIHRHYFERVVMGTIVGGGAKRVREVAAQLVERGDGRQLQGLLGFLVAEALDVQTSSHNTMAKYKQLSREFNLLPSDVVEPHLEAMRLDFETGRLLVGDEARKA